MNVQISRYFQDVPRSQQNFGGKYIENTSSCPCIRSSFFTTPMLFRERERCDTTWYQELPERGGTLFKIQAPGFFHSTTACGLLYFHSQRLVVLRKSTECCLLCFFFYQIKPRNSISLTESFFCANNLHNTMEYYARSVENTQRICESFWNTRIIK